jgi:hypothetical protein
MIARSGKPRARPAVFHDPLFPASEKSWHVIAPARAVARRDIRWIACPERSVAMRSERGSDGQVSD